MKLTNTLTALIAAISLVGCATMAVDSDFDPAANFTGLKAYAWLPEPGGQGDDNKARNPLMDAYIRTAIEKGLAAKGYVLGDAPDFQVGYHASVQGRQSVQVMNSYYGYGPGWYGPAMMAPSVPVAQVYEYSEGTLIIDIVDPEARKLVWRGSAQADLDRNPSTEQKQHKVDEAVTKILERFPPKK
jgi:hypothetical protein